ncbi:MAG: hypothetical protein ACI9O4_000185 [Chitinophagales bacterium]|jgi:hypothetical protein
MQIKLEQREEIDDKRWNGCVHFALGAPPYAYTWYLDNVCENWVGLVVGNYKMVMPIVLGKKFGIGYSYQPFFTQQLGIYADIPISKATIDQFFKAIPKEIKYLDISLNESNFAPSQGIVTERYNYLLDMKPEYELLRKQYSGNVKRKVKKAEKEELIINKQISPEDFADFYRTHTAPKVEGFKDKHYYSMLRLIYKAIHYNMGFIIGVQNQDKELLAANFLINHPQRLVNLMPASSPLGNSVGAMTHLLNHLIQTNAGQYKYLDFEGSMIDGVANFYRGFGAKKAKYFQVKVNLLPKLLRIFKS